MLLILSVGLFPLGVIAILASVQSAQQNRADRFQEVQTELDYQAQHLDAAIARSVLTIRAASAAIAVIDDKSRVCERTLARLAATQMMRGSYALCGDKGRLRCATPGYVPPTLTAGEANGTRMLLTDDGALRFILYGGQGDIEAIGEYLRPAVTELVEGSPTAYEGKLELVQESGVMLLRNAARRGPLMRTIVLANPIAGGQLQLRITTAVVPISAAELLLILLPVVMWVAAAVIGWLIVDRLLLKPLVRMQRAVASYRPGDQRLDLPFIATPAREIGELGEAFDQVTRTVARHEADLEAAVDRQTRLVREVHHRVKNNLQVVASLLNLHSRSSPNDEVAAAYASIQRRVDALAVVHRNHYAELEDNRGVALKPLVSELAANLRATAPRSAAAMAISLNVEAVSVTQDVAVSIAFLITEMVEFAMFSGAPAVRIRVAAVQPAAAMLTIESASLRQGAPHDPHLFERFDRVVTGLSRQLRASMTRDGEVGSYSLPIAVLDKAG